jgi:ABC-type phosphate transport system substrate-binding protein
MSISKPAVFLLTLALIPSCFAGDLVVIVSARNPVTALRQEQVAEIFLSQTGQFPSGRAAVAIDQPLGAPRRDEFYNRVLAKTPVMVKSYWTKMVFTGRGQPPREVAGSEAVKKLVAANPELIGYIDSDVLDDSVRPVLVLR